MEDKELEEFMRQYRDWHGQVRAGWGVNISQDVPSLTDMMQSPLADAMRILIDAGEKRVTRLGEHKATVRQAVMEVLRWTYFGLETPHDLPEEWIEQPVVQTIWRAWNWVHEEELLTLRDAAALVQNGISDLKVKDKDGNEDKSRSFTLQALSQRLDRRAIPYFINPDTEGKGRRKVSKAGVQWLIQDIRASHYAGISRDESENA